MKFNNNVPKWDAQGIEPPESLQKEGFLAGYKPPAHYFNYLFNRIVAAIKEVQTGLSNVDNTADKNKPVSTAQKAAIDAMAISGKGAGRIISVADAAKAPYNTFNAYGASKQETTKGEQLFNAAKIYTTIIGGATVNNNGDGSFTVSGSGALTDAFETRYYVAPEEFTKLFKAGTLHLKTEGVTFPFLYVNLYKDNVFVSTILSNKNIATTNAELLEEYFDGTYSLYIGFNGAANDKEIAANTIKPILYQDGDGTFEKFTGGKPAPNPDYPQVINSVGASGSMQFYSCGKNLVKNTATTQVKNGITFTVNDDKTVTVSGTATEDVSLFVFTNLQNVLKVGEKYILNGSPSGCSIDTCYMEINHIWYGDIGNGSDFTFKDGITGCYIVVRSGATVLNKVFKPMIRLATVEDDTYEQHKEKIVTVPLTNSLHGVPVNSGGNYTDESGQQWVCDEIDTTRGVYIQRIQKATYNGSENWLKSVASVDDFSYYLVIANAVRSSVMCNRLGKKNGDNPYITMTSTGGGKPAVLVNLGGYMSVNSIEQFKRTLANYPIEVYYILADPIETKLTNEQLAALYSLHSYEGYTNVCTNDIGGLALEYFKNTDNGKAAGIVKQDCIDVKVMLGDMDAT